MTTRTALCAALALLASAPAAEFRAAYGNWAFDLSGTSTEGGSTYDFEKDLDARRAGKRSLQLAWDTGPGWWRPDLALSDSKIGATGSHTENTTGLPLGPSTVTLTVDADFHDSDLVARWPFNAGPLVVSAGLAAKHLSGTVVITDSSQSQPSRSDYDETFPELHLLVRWPVARWVALEAMGQGVQYGDNRAFEIRAGIELRPFDPLLLEASWQQRGYDVKAGADALDATLQGVMLRAGILVR